MRPVRYPEDLPFLTGLPTYHIKPLADWIIYPTLVAEVEGERAGYCQWSFGVDKVLHSYALRVDEKFQRRGVGIRLLGFQRNVARDAGGRMHYYAIEEQRVGLVKMVERFGLHRCQIITEGVSLFVGQL